MNIHKTISILKLLPTQGENNTKPVSPEEDAKNKAQSKHSVNYSFVVL